MDWNKTKTIFIIVFSILNVFLYSLYLNRLTDAQNVQVMGKTSTEDLLAMDNITYSELPPYINDPSYLSAKSKRFTEEQLADLDNQVAMIEDGTRIKSSLNEPVSVMNSKGDYDFTEFLSKNVLFGTDYLEWNIDKEARQAIFFQKVKDNPIYFSSHAMLTLFMNREGEVTRYEQSMFDEFDRFNRKKDLISPIEAIGNLHSRRYLPQESTIQQMTLGYSMFVQVTETQVFAPTWHVRVELKDGQTEDYFINAIEGKMIDFQMESPDEDNE